MSQSVRVAPDTIARLLQLRSARPVHGRILLRTVDERPSSLAGQISISRVDASARLGVSRLTDADIDDELPELQAVATVSFFGLQRTDAGNPIARSHVRLLVRRSFGEQSPLVDSLFVVDRVIRRVRGTNPYSAVEQLLLDSLEGNLARLFEGLASDEASQHRRITAVGISSVSADSAAAIAAAIANGLTEAARTEWGVALQSTTQVVDLSSVTVETQTQARTLVRWLRVRPSGISLLPDNTTVVVFDALISRDH